MKFGKYGRLFGWVVILFLSFLPVLQWYFFGPDGNTPFASENITHSLGQIAGLVGMNLFALTFVLSMRLKFVEDIFGGLDKVYMNHSMLGALAFFLIMLHPVFLVARFIPDKMETAVKHLLPGWHFSVTLGIFALAGMVLLMYFTFYIRLKYNVWKFSHKFFGLFFILAVFHIFLVRDTAAQDFIFSGYYVYAGIVSLIGIGAFVYSLFFREMVNRTYYKIKEINVSNGNVWEIVLFPLNKGIEYRSGQFVFLKFFNKKVGRESHPFSISSESNDPNLSVIVKNLGDYTSRLGNLKVGEKVGVEGPYGRFNVDRSGGASQIWIAGGIGVTPFIGIAGDMAKGKNKIGNVDMYYTVRTKKDLLKMDYFKRIEAKTKGKFRVAAWDSGEMGRLNVELIEKESGSLNNKEFYLCGPEGMKKALTKDFIKRGALRGKIFTEEFDFRGG